MNEPSDDTREPDEGARSECDEPASATRKPRPGAYYYDDATGYEKYDPEEDEGETEGANENTDEGAGEEVNEVED
ncbi:MAG TPA: hypothetical protein VFX96_02860 [Pyrinomonadaceae bacterium]|nr:hypothetical protein [Pyrinomonadaceae bacterium]